MRKCALCCKTVCVRGTYNTWPTDAWLLFLTYLESAFMFLWQKVFYLIRSTVLYLITCLIVLQLIIIIFFVNTGSDTCLRDDMCCWVGASNWERKDSPLQRILGARLYILDVRLVALSVSQTWFLSCQRRKGAILRSSEYILAVAKQYFL